MTENLPVEFVSLLTDSVGEDKAKEALSSYGGSAVTSLRVNPSKAFDVCSVFPGAYSVPWAKWGYALDQRPVFTLEPLFHCGAYYVQDTSSMFVGNAFSSIAPSGKLAILDLCASPGGKTTDVASLMPFGSVLVSNEVMRSRATLLRENVSIWGNPNVIVTSDDPKSFGDGCKGMFDVILVDAPCSGEGMFRKDPRAIEQWSQDNVKLCASRQKRILADVWPSLKEGGILIYSTCTFNRYENRDNVEWMCSSLGAEPLDVSDNAALDAGAVADGFGALTFLWGIMPGEGQYVAAVRKCSACCPPSPSRAKLPDAVKVPESVARMFDSRYAGTFLASNGIKFMPSAAGELLPRLSQAVKVIHSGVIAGEIKGKDFVPSADLALSSALLEGSFPECELSLDNARKFLSRTPFTISVPKGYVIMKYMGHPLGFIKNLGNRFNSLHPLERRIRMDINATRQCQ